MIYELRTYQVVPGKMKNLNARFANITLPLFEKYNMKVIGFWETAIGEATTTELVYLLAFEDLGHYQRAWDAFISDPEWQAAKRLTEVGGPLVNVVSNKILEPSHRCTKTRLDRRHALILQRTKRGAVYLTAPLVTETLKKWR